MRIGILILVIFIAGLLMLGAAGGDSAILGEPIFGVLDQLLTLRLIPIALALLIIFSVYQWATGLIGRWWALLPAFLLAFSPLFLGYGHYVTVDIGVAAALFFAVAFLSVLIHRPTLIRGIAFVAAMAAILGLFLIAPPRPTLIGDLTHTPVFIIFIAAFAFLSGTGRILRSSLKAYPISRMKEYFTTNNEEAAMYIVIGTWWLVVGTLLPTLPFVYILTASAIKKWFHFEKSIWFFLFHAKAVLIKYGLLFAAIAAVAITTIVQYPHFLYEDRGQDLQRLSVWVSAHLPEETTIAVDYAGGDSLSRVLGSRAEEWWSALGSPIFANIEWLAISETRLKKARQNDSPLAPEDRYLWLPQEPLTRTGTIFIYYLTPDTE